MDALSVLGALMGLSFVSGLRLYSTVLAVGLGVRLGYLIIPPELASLRMLPDRLAVGQATVPSRSFENEAGQLILQPTLSTCEQ
jgi:hypothetical protein